MEDREKPQGSRLGELAAQIVMEERGVQIIKDAFDSMSAEQRKHIGDLLYEKIVTTIEKDPVGDQYGKSILYQDRILAAVEKRLEEAIVKMSDDGLKAFCEHTAKAIGETFRASLKAKFPNAGNGYY